MNFGDLPLVSVCIRLPIDCKFSLLSIFRLKAKTPKTGFLFGFSPPYFMDFRQSFRRQKDRTSWYSVSSPVDIGDIPLVSQNLFSLSLPLLGSKDIFGEGPRDQFRIRYVHIPTDVCRLNPRFRLTSELYRGSVFQTTYSSSFN